MLFKVQCELANKVKATSNLLAGKVFLLRRAAKVSPRLVLHTYKTETKAA